jgi:hypothetical protein
MYIGRDIRYVAEVPSQDKERRVCGRGLEDEERWCLTRHQSVQLT